MAILVAASCAPAGTEVNNTTGTTTTTAETTTTVEAATAPPAAATTAEENKPMSAYENKVAELHTTEGDIHIRFFPDVAPNHVKNFIDLGEGKFYDGTLFHRVIAGFMIQGGDPNTKGGDPSMWGTGGSGRNVKAEFNPVSHKRGIVSMARSQSFDSASSQFFIVVADSKFLDNQYTVFGQVTKGMDVADKIVASAQGSERPARPVKITSVTIRDAKPEETGPAPK